MGIINSIKSFLGMNEETANDFDSLLVLNDIDKLKQHFTTHTEAVDEALKQWNVADHKVMERHEKVLDNGKRVKQATLPIPAQKRIVNSSGMFLFGKPVRLVNKNKEKGTKAFEILEKLWKDMRMNGLNWETAEILLSETEVARFFIPYRDSEADPNDKTTLNSVRCVIASKSKDVTIYTRFNEFGKLMAIAKGYFVKIGLKTVEHFELHTAEFIYYFRKDINGKWERFDAKINIAGKILASYAKLPHSDWNDVQYLIERREELASRRADNNDRTAEPILLLRGEIGSWPDKDISGKSVKLDGPDASAEYLSPAMATDMVKDERETLDKDINYYTYTPHKVDEIANKLGVTSGKAMELMFQDPLMKAMKHRMLIFEPMLDREINILKAIIANIIDKSLAEEVKQLEVSLEFDTPLPKNTEEVIDMVSVALAGKASISQEMGVKIICSLFGYDFDEVMGQINKEKTFEDGADNLE